MNSVHIGREKTFTVPDRFLLIDDGPFIDTLIIPSRRKVIHFDYTKHSFNPLRDMNYKKAEDITAVIDAAFPAGPNTLTKQNSSIILFEALLSAKRLDHLHFPKSDDGKAAENKIKRVLLSPVLKRVLCRPTNLSFDGILLVRLDRSLLGDFDSYLLANLLIAQYPHTVIIPDFGFYHCPFHLSLIRQNRLITGVNFLDEVPEFKNHFLLMDKVGKKTTPQDAEVLATFAGHIPNTTSYTEFVQRAIE